MTAHPEPTDDMETSLMKRLKRRDKDGRGVLERSMFTFMGPPQLGEDKAPEGYVPGEAANQCHKCAQPWDEHERVHTGSMTYVRCPAAHRSP